jgi:hypothetical protein
MGREIRKSGGLALLFSAEKLLDEGRKAKTLKKSQAACL